MQPLNGKTAMTPEEKKVRRKERESSPFYRKLIRKRARAWYARNKEKINERRRAKFAAMTPEERAKELARAKAWRDANPDKVKAMWKLWADGHRVEIKIRDRKRYADPAFRERKKELRRKRDATPEGRAKKNAANRLYYHTHKHDEKGLAWRLKYILLPRWEKLIAEPPENVERYRRRCTVENWSLFVKWARQRGLYFDPQKNPDTRRGGKKWTK